MGAKTQAQRRCSRAPSSESFWEGVRDKFSHTQCRTDNSNHPFSLREKVRMRGRFDPLTPPSPGGRGSSRSRGVTRLPASWLAGAPSLPTEASSTGLEAFRLGPSPPSLAAEPRSLSRRAFCPAVRLWNLWGKARNVGRKAFRAVRKAFWVACKAFCLARKAQSLAAEPRSLVATAFDLAHEAPVLRGRCARPSCAARDG